MDVPPREQQHVLEPHSRPFERRGPLGSGLIRFFCCFHPHLANVSLKDGAATSSGCVAC